MQSALYAQLGEMRLASVVLVHHTYGTGRCSSLAHVRPACCQHMVDALSPSETSCKLLHTGQVAWVDSHLTLHVCAACLRNECRILHADFHHVHG